MLTIVAANNSETFIFFPECLIEAAEIICQDNGPVIKKTYPEV
jgi:hypothetical protein